jgi:hypothetical protein
MNHRSETSPFCRNLETWPVKVYRTLDFTLSTSHSSVNDLPLLHLVCEKLQSPNSPTLCLSWHRHLLSSPPLTPRIIRYNKIKNQHRTPIMQKTNTEPLLPSHIRLWNLNEYPSYFGIILLLELCTAGENSKIGRGTEFSKTESNSDIRRRITSHNTVRLIGPPLYQGCSLIFFIGNKNTWEKGHVFHNRLYEWLDFGYKKNRNPKKRKLFLHGT